MRPGVQDFMKVAGDESCLALQLIAAAEQHLKHELDIIKALYMGADLGWLYFNFKDYKDPQNFRVDFGAKFFSALVGEEFDLVHEAANYQELPGEYAIYKYAREVATKDKPVIITHFNSPRIDTLVYSKTVAEGKLVGKRILRKKNG